MVLTATMAVAALAQTPTPIPLSKDVRHGQLPNGLNYYILHNEEPKERVNFYIAQKVGSTLETPEQLGLAHFLEHMAFNGTAHYPGKNMLNYLQSKGIRFGADINAYTSFDETVYNINNVPSTDKALMDSVLLVLSDWSGSILLEEDEINAERGVIEEEWRARNNAQSRMIESILPQIYKEYQYQQTPIGKMEIVRNFPPKAIRDYYHKWYRPDQQGIVIVGDMDAEEMEKKVVELFSKIPMPENAAERVYPTVSDNEAPIFAQFADKEYPYTMMMVSFKSDKIPFEYRNTDMAFVQESVLFPLISKMINNRLNEYSQKPECKYSYAGVAFEDFMVSKTKAAFTITIVAKNTLKEAYEDALAIVARACKTGFMPGELDRARDEMLANYEKAYNERNKTNTETLAEKLIRTFVDNEPYAGAEGEYNIMKQMLPGIPVQAINMLCAQLLTPNNQVIIISRPEREGMEMVEESVVTGDLNRILNAEYEPYVDEVLPESILKNQPKAGKVKSQKPGKFGTTEFTLSNGAKVIVKNTDFSADEILFSAVKKGGRNIYPEASAADVNLINDAFETCKVGEYKASTINKYLAGKKVSLTFNIGNMSSTMTGSSTVKDLPYMMELLYGYFTDLQPDQEAYDATMSANISVLQEQEKSPNYIFQLRLAKARACNNPMYVSVPSVDLIKSADYAKMVNMAKSAMSNAADYTFLFVGNVDENTLKPLLEKYVASLPSKGKAIEAKSLRQTPAVQGQVDVKFDQPMETPSTQLFVSFDNNDVPFNVQNDIMISSIGELLSNIYTDTLREEEGGTYSPYAFGSFNMYNGYWSLNYLVQTNADVQQKLMDRADAELRKLLSNGADEVNFNKVKQANIKQNEINERTNSYWNNGLISYVLGHDVISGRKEAINSMTLSGLNAFMKKLDINKNKLEFVMTGVPVKK